MPNPPPQTPNELHINMPGSAVGLAVDFLLLSDESPNLVFCGTPGVRVSRFRPCYEPFPSMGFNVYALNFSGTGPDEGRTRNFSLDSVVGDLELLVDHIRGKSSQPIFLFGGTGAGGILAQHYASGPNRLSAFAQYGVCLGGDPSPLKYSPRLLSYAHRLMKIAQSCAHFSISLKAPAYSGFNADRENAFYEELARSDPEMFRAEISCLNALLSMFLGQSGRSEEDIRVPTLIFKILHDRYYPSKYFDRYFARLSCPKYMVEINDVHSSYFFHPQKIAKEAANWFKRHL